MSLFDRDSPDSLFRRAREAASRVREKSIELVSDEKLADLVVRAAAKQESVNEALRKRGSRYRISNIDIEIGLPPSVSFRIRRLHEQDEDEPVAPPEA